MPPKAKYTSEEIVEAAVNITREKGINAVTAREVGAVLGVSSRPLFTYFETVDDLKRAVYAYAKSLYLDYVKNGMNMESPVLGVGMQFLRFASEEPQLYRVLFLAPPCDMNGGTTEFLKLSQDLVRESIMRIYNMDAETADKYFRDLWFVGYSFATLIALGECPYSEEEIGSMFTEFSLSICKAIKEIEGFTSGDYDRDALFRELVKK